MPCGYALLNLQKEGILYTELLYTATTALLTNVTESLDITEQMNIDDYQLSLPKSLIIQLTIACVGTLWNSIIIWISYRILIATPVIYNLLMMLLAISDNILLCSVCLLKPGFFAINASFIHCGIIICFAYALERFIAVKYPLSVYLRSDRVFIGLLMVVIIISIVCGMLAWCCGQ